MAKVRVESKCEIYDGMSITFKAPCDCTAVDGLNVYHAGVAQSFTFRDAHGNDLAGLDNLFSSGTYVKVVLDTTKKYAYLQNADTNAYLEEILAEKLDANMGLENAGLYLKVGPDGSLTYANPIAKFSQGPVLITSSQTVDLSQYGLRVGDQINVVCVGGGGGGGAGGSSSSNKGGDAGKGGAGSEWYDSWAERYQGTGGGGGGGGYGGGGGGGGCNSSGGSIGGSSGGGSGYLSYKTITLTSTSVAVTIGAGGAGGNNGNGKDGGATSFGSYISAAGGKGGLFYAKGGAAGGVGGHNGGQGSSSTSYPGGGGGGGGWIIESATVHTGSHGEVGNVYDGGNGGSGGGAGGYRGYGTDGGPGHGVVAFWY